MKLFEEFGVVWSIFLDIRVNLILGKEEQVRGCYSELEISVDSGHLDCPSEIECWGVLIAPV